ncbi:MAG: 2-oxo acid dehydrogenase subunit E2 [Anaerolineae bacterium]|jgi:pyruvate dehydrogenase E2 component (dihydrolipoamide acetyltransferase)
MVKEIILPKLGQTMEEGTIVEWLKEEGDAVSRGEVLFSLESDKATLDVESSAKGFLRKILASAGETVPVLTVVGLITKTPSEDVSDYEVSPRGAETEELVPEALAPSAAESKPGEAVTAERERIFASPRARRRAQEEGVDLAEVTGTGPRGRIVEQDVLEALASLPKATPVAQRLAEHEGIDLKTLTGTGLDGRITKADVERALPEVKAPAPAAAAEVREVTAEVPMRGVRARIAERMQASHRTTAPVTLTTEVDADAFVETRERLKTSLEGDLGFKLGYNDLLIKLAARALREFPYVNARIVQREEGEAVIRQLDGIHVALAVDTERGLLVPVIRGADRKGLKEIARELRGVVERVREGSALPEELSGSTFTITNLGMYGIDAFTPLINLPEAAILGVGRIKERPAVVDGEVSVRKTMWLSLTFDHRLVDGAPAARFLQRIKELVEEPYLLLA